MTKRMVLALMAMAGVGIATYLTLYKTGAIGELVFQLGIVDGVEDCLESRAGLQAGGGQVIAGDEGGGGVIGFVNRQQISPQLGDPVGE